MSENPPESKPLTVDEAIDFASSRDPLPGYWKGTLSVIFAYFIIATLNWFMDECPWYPAVRSVTWPAIVFCGWVQHWSLFSPEVRDVIYHETAVVTFEDGSERLYEFPRTNKMSQWDRFKHEKMRKMFGDNMPWPSYKPFWPVFARFIARCNYDRGNQPVSVVLVWNSIRNPRPEEEFIRRNNLPRHIYKSITFVYQVRKPDLDIDGNVSDNRIYAPTAATMRVAMSDRDWSARRDPHDSRSEESKRR